MHNDYTFLEITGTAITSLTILGFDVEFGFKLAIGVITICYMLWKWRVEFLKEKKLKNK